MSAIGAVTSISMPRSVAPVTGVGAAAQWSTSGAASTTTGFDPAPVAPATAGSNVRPSGVQGMDLSGDPLSDMVLATYASNPLGYGSLDGAMDRVSASMSFVPGAARQPRVPGSTIKIEPANAFNGDSAVEDMSTSDFIARSQSSIAAIWGDGLAVGKKTGSVRAGMMDMATALDQQLHPPGGGLNVFDRKLAALEVAKHDITDKLRRRVGDPRALVAQLLSLTIQQGMVQREREKSEELLKLLISLIIGVQIPQGCVERLVALGMGDMVKQLIQEMVGDGKGLSKSMRNQVAGLASMGIDVSVVQETDTNEGRKDASRKLELAAALASDGRLIDAQGRTVASNAVRGGDLGDALRRRAAGFSPIDLATSQAAASQPATA